MNPGSFYHIYNHANGRENLFVEEKNYDFFLGRIAIYVLPFINLHAYCLLPNHFHLLISIKEIEEIKLLPGFKNLEKLSDENLQPFVEAKVSKAFSNLFSSYTQSFNKIYARKGSLFMPNMKLKIVEDETGICKVAHYVHANPVHHGFVSELANWKYSSYNAYLSNASTKLSKQTILDIFGSKEYFIEYHQQSIELKYNWDD